MVERYRTFTDGELEFGTEFDLNSQLASIIQTLSWNLKLMCGQYSSLRICPNGKESSQFNEDASTILLDLCQSRYATPERILNLLKLGANPNYVEQLSLKSCLHGLVKTRNHSCVKVLILCSTVDIVHSVDLEGFTPLMRACMISESRQQIQLVRALLLKGDCKLNFTNANGLSAVACALKERNVRALQLLLIQGAGVLTLSGEFLSSLLDTNKPDGATATSDEFEDVVIENGEEKEEIVEPLPEQTLEDFTDPPAVRKQTSTASVIQAKPQPERQSFSVREPSVIHSNELSRQVVDSSSSGVVLEKLIQDQTVDYRLSVLSLAVYRIKHSMSKSQLCQRMVNYRLIEEERELKKALVRYENKTTRHLMTRTQSGASSTYDEVPVKSAAERKSLRQSRRRAKLSKRVPLETSKQKRELELWDVIRARILSRIDKEYNVHATMKGLFK